MVACIRSCVCVSVKCVCPLISHTTGPISLVLFVYIGGWLVAVIHNGWQPDFIDYSVLKYIAADCWHLTPLKRSIRDANDQLLQFGIFVSMRDNVKKKRSHILAFAMAMTSIEKFLLILYYIQKNPNKIFKTLQVSSGCVSGSCSRCFKIFIQDSPSSARHMVDVLHISVASVLAV